VTEDEEEEEKEEEKSGRWGGKTDYIYYTKTLSLSPHPSFTYTLGNRYNVGK
jgi:hypothetical protein